MSTSPRFPVKSIGNRTPRFYRLIGYELVEKKNSKVKGVYMYHYLFYWLKLHDRDISPDGVYKGPKGFCGRMPSEAVNPVRLVERSPYPVEEEGILVIEI
jgi:hypothetical protein